jgi:hypothetical protein
VFVDPAGAEFGEMLLAEALAEVIEAAAAAPENAMVPAKTERTISAASTTARILLLDVFMVCYGLQVDNVSFQPSPPQMVNQVTQLRRHG